MSDDILNAVEYRHNYLQSPVDDLFSFYYTMQWAAVFRNQEFAAKDIPFELKILREKLLGNNRSATTLQITAPSLLFSHEYGLVVAKCHPVLRAWYLELQSLRVDWNRQKGRK